MKQRGFILPGNLTLYAIGGAMVVIVLLSIALWVQTNLAESWERKYESFVAQTKAVGEAQAAKTKETENKHNKILKEKNDEITLARAKHAADVKRLRDKHSSSSPVPEAPADSSKPGLACFERAELNLALRGFLSEVDGFIAEGQSCAIELNNAREWAKSIKE